MSKFGGIQIKELPSNDNGCLIAVNEGQASGKGEDKLKSVIVK